MNAETTAGPPDHTRSERIAPHRARESVEKTSDFNAVYLYDAESSRIPIHDIEPLALRMEGLCICLERSPVTAGFRIFPTIGISLTPRQKKPPKTVYTEAARHKVTSYQRVPRALGQFKGCLASGYPFVLGFTVYTAFEDEAVARSGELNMPSRKEEVLGGHAVLAVGYDD